jgi:SAM-dependent methyltransferase
MALPQPHLDRARASSFGAVAELYDRFRPSYPEALIDDLVALKPAQVVDVGCGTGQVARALAARGLSVLGVEPDAQMAAVARHRGLEVEVSGFEAWDDRGRRFGLLTCGAAWHWIDPELGLAKAVQVLTPGGTLARFWTFEVPEEPVRAALEAVYGEHAPQATRFVPRPPDNWPDPVVTSGAFTAIETRTYAWSRTLSTEAWVGMVTTFSDHQRLEPARLAALQRALTEAIDRLGGTVHVDCGTWVRFARRV